MVARKRCWEAREVLRLSNTTLQPTLYLAWACSSPSTLPVREPRVELRRICVLIHTSLKAYRPDLNVQIIIYSIWTIVASTFAPSFPDMRSGLDFARRLLLAYLAGMAIATGVSLFVLPRTSRQTVSLQNSGFLRLMKACLSSHGKYLERASQGRPVAVKGEKLNEDTGPRRDSHHRGFRLHRKKTSQPADLPGGPAEAAQYKNGSRKRPAYSERCNWSSTLPVKRLHTESWAPRI